MFSKDDLSTLLNPASGPAVSILMPGVRAGREVRQNEVRFNNLMKQANDRLMEMGMRQDDARALLQRAHDSVSDPDFWQYADNGMAFFVTPDFFRWFSVPTQLPEEARVGRVFHITPLLPLLSHDGRYVLVTASAARIRVFDAGRYWVRERDGLDFPSGVDEVAAQHEFQPQYHSAPQGRPSINVPGGMPGRQGTNDAEDLRHAQLREYLRRSAVVLEGALSGETVPVVLAAQPNIQGHFRAMLKLPTLLSDGLSLNPDPERPEDISAKALPLVEPTWQEGEQDARKKFAALQGEHGDEKSKITTRPDEILKAARFGQVECLFVAADRTLWGKYDPRTEKLVVHGRQGVEDDDLADVAAAETLLHSGQVEITDHDHLPGGHVMAALLRY